MIFNNLNLKKFQKSDFFKENKVNLKDFKEEMIGESFVIENLNFMNFHKEEFLQIVIQM